MSPTTRRSAPSLVETRAGRVETGVDARAGVERAARGGFNRTLMETNTPDIAGLKPARRIRALGGGAAETPIIALTANVLAHQRRSYLDAGMDGVVGKPIAPAALLAEIAAAASRRAGAESVAA